MRPLAVAITGGIGAGKTEALEAFARHGAATLSADETVHRLLADDDGVRAAVRGRWGDRIFRADGSVDRGAVAEVVFADETELAWLEEVLHPRVRRDHDAWLERVAERPEPPALVAIEVPLLYETGGESRFDAVVAVTAPLELRRERGRDVPEARVRRQIPDEEKLRRADFDYVNDGSLEELDAFVASVVAALAARR